MTIHARENNETRSAMVCRPHCFRAIILCKILIGGSGTHVGDAEVVVPAGTDQIVTAVNNENSVSHDILEV